MGGTDLDGGGIRVRWKGSPPIVDNPDYRLLYQVCYQVYYRVYYRSRVINYGGDGGGAPPI